MYKVYLKKQPMIALSYFDKHNEYKPHTFPTKDAAMLWLKQYYNESTITFYYDIR